MASSGTAGRVLDALQTAIPAAVLAAYDIRPGSGRPIGSGLINLTLRVETRTGRPLVLQRLNPVFPPAINADLDAVSEHLGARGLRSPRVLATADGALWVTVGDATWRALTYIDGVSHEALQAPDQARAAGALLARFHGALLDFDGTFQNPRLGVHDTPRHLARLREALARHREHRELARVEPLAEVIFALAARLPDLARCPDRVVHGDPKISNILFDARTGEALCLVDLDTLARMPLPLELGDAFRSWCNPKGEDSRLTGFSLALFEAAIGGYAAHARDWITRPEWQAIVPAIRTIYVELAARFCADALNEAYFGWDPQRFASRSEHNQVRAASQVSAVQSLEQHLAAAERIVAAAFADPSPDERR